MRLICKPTLWNLPENVKVKKLLASQETFAIVTSKKINDVLKKFEFI